MNITFSKHAVMDGILEAHFGGRTIKSLHGMSVKILIDKGLSFLDQSIQHLQYNFAFV